MHIPLRALSGKINCANDYVIYFSQHATTQLRQSNMGHITDQYGPYYRPIWAILVNE